MRQFCELRQGTYVGPGEVMNRSMGDAHASRRIGLQRQCFEGEGVDAGARLFVMEDRRQSGSRGEILLNDLFFRGWSPLRMLGTADDVLNVKNRRSDRRLRQLIAVLAFATLAIRRGTADAFGGALALLTFGSFGDRTGRRRAARGGAR